MRVLSSNILLNLALVEEDMKKLHLDSEYKHRFILFHLPTETLDSRVINWRNVEWEKVVKLTASLRGIEHVVDMEGKTNFKGFMNFRWGGEDHQYDPATKKYLGARKIDEWTIGWTDGENCYLKYIHFKTGKLLQETVEPLSKYKSHIHTRLAPKLIKG